ncbi:hypothetical protein [Limnothrix redekei]
MMSTHSPKSGQRPEDNVRAIADALAVYLAWSFRNSVTQVKKTTTATPEAPVVGWSASDSQSSATARAMTDQPSVGLADSVAPSATPGKAEDDSVNLQKLTQFAQLGPDAIEPILSSESSSELRPTAELRAETEPSCQLPGLIAAMPTTETVASGVNFQSERSSTATAAQGSPDSDWVDFWADPWDTALEPGMG